VALNAFIGVVGAKLCGSEFFAVVGVQHPELTAALLSSCLYLLDGVLSSSVGRQKDRPHEAGRVVHQYK
jgi:hypothetical protein